MRFLSSSTLARSSTASGAEAGRGAGFEQALLDLVEALEPGVVGAAVEVLLAEVDGLVEVGEELGDGLDALPRDAGGGVQRLGRVRRRRPRPPR